MIFPYDCLTSVTVLDENKTAANLLPCSMSGDSGSSVSAVSASSSPTVSSSVLWLTREVNTGPGPATSGDRATSSCSPTPPASSSWSSPQSSSPCSSVELSIDPSEVSPYLGPPRALVKLREGSLTALLVMAMPGAGLHVSRMTKAIRSVSVPSNQSVYSHI